MRRSRRRRGHRRHHAVVRLDRAGRSLFDMSEGARAKSCLKAQSIYRSLESALTIAAIAQPRPLLLLGTRRGLPGRRTRGGRLEVDVLFLRAEGPRPEARPVPCQRIAPIDLAAGNVAHDVRRPGQSAQKQEPSEPVRRSFEGLLFHATMRRRRFGLGRMGEVFKVSGADAGLKERAQDFAHRNTGEHLQDAACVFRGPWRPRSHPDRRGADV